MRIRTTRLDGDVDKVDLLGGRGSAFATAFFRPEHDAEDVADQLEFLARSAREYLAAEEDRT